MPCCSLACERFPSQPLDVGARPACLLGSGLLLPLELPLVERQLLALDDVAVRTAALPGTGRDARHQPAAHELLIDCRVELLLRFAVLQLGGDVAALLLGLLSLTLLGVLGLLLLLLSQFHAILLEVPLLEGLSIHLHDHVLEQGLCTHQLIAGGIVHDVQEANLLGDVLGAPSVVATVEPQCAVLHVAPTATHRAHALLAKLAECAGAAHLELALLLVEVPAAAGLTVLVA